MQEIVSTNTQHQQGSQEAADRRYLRTTRNLSFLARVFSPLRGSFLCAITGHVVTLLGLILRLLDSSIDSAGPGKAVALIQRTAITRLSACSIVPRVLRIAPGMK